MNSCSDSNRSCAVWVVAAIAGLGLTGPAAAEAPWQIVTTIAQIADPVRQIAGDRAEVESLMGEGVDPHTYRSTRSDVAKLAAADLIFWNGLYLEAQMEETLERLGTQKPVVALGETIDPGLLLNDPTGTGRQDPHIWMDVSLWAKVVEAIRDTLVEIDPEGAATYQANAAAYLDELSRLDGYARQVLGSVPAEARVLVTAHDAFSYFGRAYGFEVEGIQGISTESEAGVRRIEELVDLLVDRGIAAVFVESSVAPRNIQALVDGAAAQGHEVAIGGQLFSDAMGPPGTYEGTYLGMIDHNVTTIARALGGTTPPDGLNGRLAMAE